MCEFLSLFQSLSQPGLAAKALVGNPQVEGLLALHLQSFFWFAALEFIYQREIYCLPCMQLHRSFPMLLAALPTSQEIHCFTNLWLTLLYFCTAEWILNRGILSYTDINLWLGCLGFAIRYGLLSPCILFLFLYRSIALQIFDCDKKAPY